LKKSVNQINIIFWALTLKKKIGTTLPFEVMTTFFHGSKEQKGKHWALLYKVVQILLNYAFYYMESTVQ